MLADAELHDRFFQTSRCMAREVARIAEETEGLPNAFLDLGDTYAVYAGDGSFLTQAKGAFTIDQVEAVKTFYAPRCSSWEVIVTPFFGTDTLRNLLNAGAEPEQWETVLYRSLPTEEVWEMDDRIATVTSTSELAVWSRTMSQGFFGDDSNPMLERLSRIYASTENTVRYLASIDGVPAAGASVWIDQRTAYFAGAATRPEYRKRGLQNALINRRLHEASQVADVAFVGTSPGSNSQRNLERKGFQVLCNQLCLRMRAESR